MNRFPATTKVQAMIDAGGGGDGANIKSGLSTSPAKERKKVYFTTPFASIPRILLTNTISTCRIWVTEVTTDYFEWNNNNYTVAVPIHWIATTAGNA